METIKHINGITIAVLLLTFSSCSKIDDNPTTDSNKNAIEEMLKENGSNPDESVFRESILAHGGYVYTESNDSQINKIFVYKKNYNNGELQLMQTVASGGIGTSSPLESQGALKLDADHNILYAVNAGSDSVSSFKVMDDGSVTLNQTINTIGKTPVSLTIHENLLYVVNAGTNSINGFHIGPNGLSHIRGSNKTLSSDMAGPAQISFSPNGNYLYVTERLTNTISKFPVDDTGLAGERESMQSVGNTPFGFDFTRAGYMVVSNAEMGVPNLASVTSYSGADAGYLASVNGAIRNEQTSSCWVSATSYGRFAFVSNTGSNSLSSYYIDRQGNLAVIEEKIISGDGPIDLIVAADNYTVYALCKNDHTIQIYKRTENGGLVRYAKIPGLPDHAAGLADW